MKKDTTKRERLARYMEGKGNNLSGGGGFTNGDEDAVKTVERADERRARRKQGQRTKPSRGEQKSGKKNSPSGGCIDDVEVVETLRVNEERR